MTDFYVSRESFDNFTDENITLAELVESELTDNKLHELHDSDLDEIYGTVTVAGYEYDTARALKSLDEVAYNESFNNFIDAECKNTGYGSIVSIDPETGSEDY